METLTPPQPFDTDNGLNSLESEIPTQRTVFDALAKDVESERDPAGNRFAPESITYDGGWTTTLEGPRWDVTTDR